MDCSIGNPDQISIKALFTLAERESGGSGLADDGLVRRVSGLVAWINQHGPYSVDQVRAIQEQILRLLVNRLKVALDRKRYSQIREERIEQPIFIVGFARSGTTVLHSLLAEDPDTLKPMSWHMYSPSPPPGKFPVAAGRLAYAQRQVEAWSDFCPAQKVYHPYVDKGAFQLIEDEEVFALDFRNAYPFHYYRVPSLEPGMTLVTTGQGDAFRFHQTLLQHMQWGSQKTRWICKGPSHQMNLEALFEVYPDALCIWAHRPIGEIYASNVGIRAATYDAIRGEPVDWSSQARAHAKGLKAAVDGLIESDMIDDPRILHIAFHEISRDPLSVIGRIYERRGWQVSQAMAKNIQGWLANPENASDRYGKILPSCEEFGLDRAWVEELFANYSDKFGLTGHAYGKIDGQLGENY